MDTGRVQFPTPLLHIVCRLTHSLQKRLDMLKIDKSKIAEIEQIEKSESATIRPLVKIGGEDRLYGMWRIEKAIKDQFDLDKRYCARVLLRRWRIYIHHQSHNPNNFIEITFCDIDRKKTYTSKINLIEARQIARHIWNVCHDL